MKVAVASEFKWLISLGVAQECSGAARDWAGGGMTNEIAAAAQNANEMCNAMLPQGWGHRWAMGCFCRTIGLSMCECVNTNALLCICLHLWHVSVCVARCMSEMSLSVVPSGSCFTNFSFIGRDKI